MDFLLRLGDGSIIFGVLCACFAVLGLILVIRGAISNIDDITDKFTFRKDWHASLMFLFLLLSYMALAYAITKLPI